jgi:hypothetical protein
MAASLSMYAQHNATQTQLAHRSAVGITMFSAQMGPKWERCAAGAMVPSPSRSDDGGMGLGVGMGMVSARTLLQ